MAGVSESQGFWFEVLSFDFLLNGLWPVWTGVAALYMVWFLYNQLRVKVFNSETLWIDYLVVGMIFVLATASVHGWGLLASIFEYSIIVGDGVAQWVSSLR